MELEHVPKMMKCPTSRIHRSNWNMVPLETEWTNFFQAGIRPKLLQVELALSKSSVYGTNLPFNNLFLFAFCT